jgi:hypothetical protein
MFINLVFLLALLLPASALLLRYQNNPTIPGHDSYYHLLQAYTLNSYTGLEQDKFLFSVYDTLLSFNPVLFSQVLPLIFTVASLAVLYLLLQRLGFGRRLVHLAMFFMVLSPLTLHLGVLSDGFAFTFFLLIVGAYLFLSKDLIKVASSLVFFVLLLFSGPIYLFLLVLSLITYYLVTGKLGKRILGFLIIFGVVFMFYYGWVLFAFGIPMHSALDNLIPSFLSELGASTGFSVFNLLLVAWGLIFIWKQKKIFYPIPFYLLIVAFSFVYFSGASLFLLVPFQLLAAYGLIKIGDTKWILGRLHYYSVGLLVVALLISSFTYHSTLVSAEPTQEIIEGLLWLKGEKVDGFVLSDASRGYWIEAVAQKQAYTGSESIFIQDRDYRKNVSQTLLFTRNLVTAKNIAKENRINYLFIDPAMKDGLVWQREDEGILFLFRNNETFKKVYSLHGVEIWKVMTNDINK